MKFNPFQPNSIVAPGAFVGRQEEIATIERCLFQAKNGNPQHFLIEGERGIGKSSLMLLVDTYSSGAFPSPRVGHLNFLTLSVDMGGVETQLDVVKAIARELRTKLSRMDVVREKTKDVIDFLLKWEVLGVRFHGVANAPDPDDARDDLVNRVAEVMSQTAGVLDGAFIIIDEADAPPESADLGEFVKLFTERLTRRGCNSVLLGLAGLPTAVQKMKASHESSPRIFEVLRLEPLEPDEIAQVIARGIDFANQRNTVSTTVTPAAMELLCELSEGYPHFIQQFSYSAFAYDTDDVIDVDDVVGGAYRENGALPQLGRKYFNEMYFGKVGSEDYRQVLRTMAAHGDDWVSRKTLLDESGVKASTINNALNALKSRNIISVDEGRQGHYKLPTKSFAAWINAFQIVSEKTDHEASLFGEDGEG